MQSRVKEINEKYFINFLNLNIFSKTKLIPPLYYYRIQVVEEVTMVIKTLKSHQLDTALIYIAFIQS